MGSYFKSSTRSLVVDTPAARASAFVLPEVQLGLAVEQGKTFIVMISPEQYREVESAFRAGVQATRRQLATVVFTLATEPNQQ